jgi:osmotically-inducible protein OsmY
MAFKNYKYTSTLGIACFGLLLASGFAAQPAYSTDTVKVQDKARMAQHAGNPVQQVVDDTVISARVTKRLSDTGESALRGIKVDVNQGRVMLVGSVADTKQIVKALSAAWEVPGVREVISELEVADHTVGERVEDSYIATKVRTKLLMQKGITSSHYSVEVYKGIVYLFGITPSRNELNLAMDVAKDVKGVQKVVNHVIVR